MISVNKAADLLLRSDNSLKITSCKDYGKDYLFTALKNGNERSFDPFYLVDKHTGKINGYSIAEDPNKYYDTPEINWR